MKHKESNRAITLQEELGKMGVEIILEDDKMMITGGNELNGTVVHSHHDHRFNSIKYHQHAEIQLMGLGRQ